MDKSILTTLSRTQKITLLLLAIDNSPIKGKIWHQKEVFLISKNDNELKQEVEFEPHHYGPYSYEVQGALEDLEAERLVEVFDDGIYLTKEGSEIANELKKQFNASEIEFYRDVKFLLNDLSKMELLAFIYQTNKEMTTQSVELENVKKRLVEYAISLFEKKKLSVGKAAEISGLSLSKFISELKKRGILIATGL